MSKLPLVALIGLPNAGKSTLLNRLTGTKTAIVAKEAHTTRDLNYGEDWWESMFIRFVDTGGLVPSPEDKIQKAVQVRSWSAISEADLLIWVIDRKQDPDSISEKIIQKIWKTGKPVLICINKVDDPNLDKSIADYARLGGVGFANVSATTGYGLSDMMDTVLAELFALGFEVTSDKVIVDNQKVKSRKKVPKEVRKHASGGYYIVRNEEGMFESVAKGDYSKSGRDTEETAISKVKNIVFDFWGVIYHEDTAQLAQSIAIEINKEDKLEEIKAVLDELIHLVRNNLSIKDWLVKYKELTGLEPFSKDIWGDNYYVNEEVVDFIFSASDDYNIYYLTNIDEYNFEKCAEEDFFDEFKGGIASYQTEFKKPQKEIYQLLLDEYKLNPEETVFIDDRPENIEAAKQFGLNGIVFDTEKTDLEKELKTIEQRLNGELDESIPKILLLGKPNVGKSSLFNSMVGKEIQIVTDIAGTTLSVNDTLIEREEKQYILLDSTGIRRPGQRTFGAESFATYRTIQSAYEADVICVILDGSEPLSHQDQVVAGICKEAKKGIVVIANKADLVDADQKQKFIRDFYNKFAFLKVNKFIWVSAKETEDGNLKQIWETIDESLASRSKEIDRAELRKLFNYLMKQKPPKKLRIKRKPVVYDLLYTRSKPPTFELLVKDRNTIHWSYLRFLENILRENFGFEGTEIVVKVTEIDRSKVMSY